MLKSILAVGIGGAIGSVLRFSIGQFFKNISFPIGTMLINIAGCFMIGFFTALIAKNPYLNPWKLFITAGVCGGFTTFSAFGLENLQLLQDGKWPQAMMYTLASVMLGIASTWAGFKMTA